MFAAANQEDSLKDLSRAAESFWERGHLVQAEETARCALDGQKQLLGDGHRETLTTATTLAGILKQQDRDDEAAIFYENILQTADEVLGGEDLVTLRVLNDFGLLLQKQRKYDAARRMHEQAVRAYVAHYGEEHSSSISSMTNLARVMKAQRDYEEAEDLFRHGLALREELLGVTHPETMDSAESLVRETAGRQLALMGGNSPDLLQCMSSFAILMLDHGRTDATVEIAKRAVETRKHWKDKHSLDTVDPNTLTSLNNLAGVLQSCGHHYSAEEIHREVLEGSRLVLGPDHPNTLSTCSNLAQVLEKRGAFPEADDLKRQAYQGRVRVLGPEHSRTIASMADLVDVLAWQEKCGEATELNISLVDVKRKVLGADDPSTLWSMCTLGMLYERQGDLRAARDTFDTAFAAAKTVCPPDHSVRRSCEAGWYRLKDVEDTRD
ncbi:TPR domain protein [Aspergillus fumigatus A1163]|uniref:TPR domain protein n=1 Tax=Aspergillus fumigatus (strain CBS 144.89 / FGSC A1163 / CEA10) TaxID=451804 RepID=B0XWN1_ASPFC|nr:TPR domain protein [Aspergillus fumigatus A1163]